MRKGIKNILLIITLFFINSCQFKSLNSMEYLLYLQNKNNEFNKEIKTDNLIFNFQFKTPEYIAINELGNTKNIKLLQNRINTLKNTIWFNVSIKTKKGDINPLKKDVTDLTDYNKRLNYFLMEAGNAFVCKYNGIEVPKIGYFFENSYGLTPIDLMNIGFKINDEKPIEDIELSYNDNIYGNGLMKIKIEKQNLIKLPKLKF